MAWLEVLIKNDEIITDRLLRFETMDNDIKKLSDDFNLKCRKTNKINTSNRKNYKIYYNDNLVDLVNKNMNELLEKFNYSFE